MLTQINREVDATLALSKAAKATGQVRVDDVTATRKTLTVNLSLILKHTGPITPAALAQLLTRLAEQLNEVDCGD